MSHWYLFDPLKELLAKLSAPESARQANKYMLALAATVADALAMPRRRTLAEGSARAKLLLDDLRAQEIVDEASASFLAGRIASMVDVLGVAASRRAPDDVALQAGKYRALLRALYEAPGSNKELAERLGEREDVLCKDLQKARTLGLVDTEKLGRDNLNRLTALALALFDDGLMPLEGENQYSMRAAIQQTPPKHLPSGKPAEVPRLSGVAFAAVNVD